MEPGPLPPHERPWRHPSEIAPTGATIDANHRRTWGPAIVVGTLTVAVVVTLAAAVTPRSTDAPTAIEATTMPPFVTRSAGTQGVTGPDGSTPDGPQPKASTIQLAAAVAFPRAVSFVAEPDHSDVATVSPSPAETFVVVTSDEVYRAAWHDVEFCDVDDGVVTNLDGELVAVIRDGDISVVVEPPPIDVTAAPDAAEPGD